MTPTCRECMTNSHPLLQSQGMILIPAYNEERFIGSVVLRARRIGIAVVVVDDGSTDATAELAEAAGAVVLRHPINQGKGRALNTGFRFAREHEVSIVVTVDGDGQHRPEEIDAIIAPIRAGEADIVVGSRYLAQTSEVPQHRILGHRAFNLLTNRTSGIALTDSQSGFRAFSARALRAFAFRSNGFSVESEMQFLAKEHGLRMVEVPITIRYSDRPKRNVLMHGLLVLNGVLRLIGQHRPLLFFGGFGAVILLAGLLWGLFVIEIYRSTAALAVGYALISVLLALIGVMVLFTGIMLHSVRGLLLEILRPHASR